MKTLEFKDVQLISLNAAGWNWHGKEGWKERLNRICEYIKEKMQNPLVIALQEVQLSGGKYLKVLEEQFSDYHIVLPKAYKNQPRSVVSVLLINKNLCKSYNVRTLDGLEENLRYNYVHINSHININANIERVCFRILNINVPHICLQNAAEWYRKEREELRTLFISKVKELADTYRTEQDIKLIVLGDFNTVPDDKFIESLVYSYDRPMVDAVKKHDKNTATWRDLVTKTKNRLDYILYSTGMFCDTGVCAKFTLIDETTIFQGLSDHAILVGGITLKKF